jgi:hypothetical protein
MLPFKTLLERTAFHIPYSHDWLAERDALRNETGRLRATNEGIRTELEATRSRLNHLLDSLWQPPGHFYSPIPDVKDLKSNRERVFAFPPGIPDLDMNEPAAGTAESVSQLVCRAAVSGSEDAGQSLLFRESELLLYGCNRPLLHDASRAATTNDRSGIGLFIVCNA